MSRLVDAVMYDGKGKITFENKGIEVPNKGWSDRAVTICANKYFRPEQKSIEGMIDRTLDTVIHHSPQLKDHREGMKEIAIEQRGFFNTPYWINMWMGNRYIQTSACFILGLKDNMENILEMSRIEGEVYRHGSGAGINYSQLRESGASLSRGGVTSGPIPFMEIGDAMGAVIKSGGKNRRAAKSVILNDDHPDVE